MLRINDVVLRTNIMLRIDLFPLLCYNTLIGGDSVKKILCKIGDFFETLFAMIVALIFGVCVVFLLPLDYIKYKRSLYYKTEHKKYKLYAASGVNFEIYNEIIKNDLPIKFICNPDDDSLEHGWFVYNNTLIIPNVFSFEYNPETKKWNYCCEVVEEDDTEKRIIMSLEEYIEIEVQEANELAGDTICDKAIVLIDANCIENAEFAKSENKFLVYDDNREEVLKNFCNNN